MFCLDKSRRKYTIIGASESLVLSSPVGVALVNDFLYVSDSALGKVFKFDHRQRLIGTLEQFKADVAATKELGVQEIFFDPGMTPEGATADGYVRQMELIREMFG